MKKLIVLLATFASVNLAIANNETPAAEKFVDVKVVEGLKFKVAIPELNERARVVIKNNAGDVIYKETLDQTPSFVKVYNLAGFPDGQYYFEVKLNGKVITKDFSINSTVNRSASVK